MAVATLLLLLSCSLARAVQSVTLAWNASSSAGVTGYKVYYGTVAGSPNTSINVGNVTTATVSNLNDATTYFFSVAAYNSAGVESQRSSEISYRTPSSPADTYRLTVNNGSGDGTYTLGTSVIVTADPPAQGQQFAGWQGDTAILDDFTSSPTEALIISRDVVITAAYSALPTYSVAVTNGTGDGNYYAGAQVTIVADPAPAGQQFTGWTGNANYANASSPTTTFTMPSSAVVATANYGTISAGDVIRYYPREGFTSRMTGGVFEGTNGDPDTGPYTTIHTIATNPSLSWSAVNVSLGSYRYLRYRGPNGSHGNVAEMEFYRAGVKLTGTGFGTPGSWSNVGNTFAKALDGNVNTFFDGPNSDGNYVGIDAGSAGSGTAGTGLRGQYYNDSSSTTYPLANPFAGSPVLIRTDATVDFYWDTNSPGSPVNSNRFSVKWTGQVKAPVSGNYTFTVTGDDGIRLFLNGAKVIDQWRDQGAAAYSYTTTLTAGTSYTIELHYYENGGEAECRLHWSYPGQADQAIPRSQLYPTAGQ
ncbi:MAG TPA: PA14 domain-containing protein [Terrimicrobiaceae bacterium]